MIPPVNVVLPNGEQALIDRDDFRRILTAARGHLSRLQAIERNDFPAADKKALGAIIRIQNKDPSVI